ncbi:MAG: MFS transporter [Pseudoclavibacter sp.]
MSRDRDRRRLSRSIPKWFTVAALAFTGLTSAYMFTLVVPIQSELPHLLNAPREDTAWVVTITLLASACATPISGRLGDMYGKRRIVLILIGFLLLGSVIAALSPSIVGVIIGRGLQGITMGVVPLGISIMRDILPPNRLGTAVALMSATMGVGGSLGLPVSAFIVENFDWHYLFWVSALLGVIALVAVVFLVPESVIRTAGRFDFLGVVGLSAGLAGILLAISRGSDWGWLSGTTLGFGIGGVAILLVWGWYQLRTPAPLIDLRVTARPAVLFTNLAAICMGFALFGSNVLLPQMLELPVESGSGFGVGVFQTALLVMPAGVVMMLISPISGWLERTVGPRVMLTSGSIAVTLSYVFLLIWHDQVYHLFIANLIVGIGIGLGFAAMPMLIMRSVPAEETGVSNGINALARSLGTSTASAVMAAVLAAVSFDYNGTSVPTPDAFVIAFWIGAIVGLGAAALALMIPTKPFKQHHPSVPSP